MTENLYDIKKIQDGVWFVNEGNLDAMYLVQGKDRGLVIDTGTGVGDFKGLVESILTVPYDVVITHAHVDHAGGAGQFEKVYLHKDDFELFQTITLNERENYVSQMRRVHAAELLPENIIPIQRKSCNPEISFIKGGDVFELGGINLKVIECPGHTDGSIILIDEKSHLLFTGDSVNDTELLRANPGTDRDEVLRRWYHCGMNILKDMGDDEMCLGGHNMFPVSQAKDTLECGRRLLEGEIKAEKTEIHIFRGDFAKYKNVVITVDDNLETI